MTNAVLVRWANGWREVRDDASIGVHGRSEALLGLGAIGSAYEVDRLASEQLRRIADGRLAIQADLRVSSSADTPYEAFGVGDVIQVNGDSERVVAITVAEDDNGTLTYAPELRDTLRSSNERFEQALKKMADGTLSGQSQIATPVAASRPEPPPVRSVTTVVPAPGLASATYIGTEVAEHDTVSDLYPYIRQRSGILPWSYEAAGEAWDSSRIVFTEACRVRITIWQQWWTPPTPAGTASFSLEMHGCDFTTGDKTVVAGPYQMTSSTLTNAPMWTTSYVLDVITDVGAWIIPSATQDYGGGAARQLDWQIGVLLLGEIEGAPPT